MLVGSFFIWWYGLGWVLLARKVGALILRVMHFFSVGQLLGSLFAPFRQISAQRGEGSLQHRLQAWGDLLFSRIIGAVVRLILIFVGLALAIVIGFAGLVVIALWPFLPASPLIGVFLMQAGVGV